MTKKKERLIGDVVNKRANPRIRGVATIEDALEWRKQDYPKHKRGKELTELLRAHELGMFTGANNLVRSIGAYAASLAEHARDRVMRERVRRANG